MVFEFYFYSLFIREAGEWGLAMLHATCYVIPIFCGSSQLLSENMRIDNKIKAQIKRTVGSRLPPRFCYGGSLTSMEGQECILEGSAIPLFSCLEIFINYVWQYEVHIVTSTILNDRLLAMFLPIYMFNRIPNQIRLSL